MSPRQTKEGKTNGVQGANTVVKEEKEGSRLGN